MQELPAIIKKHFIGYVVILGAGLGIASIIWAGVYSLYRSGNLDTTTTWMLLFASVVVLLITIVQIWVYSLSYYEINENGLHVVNWHTLFVKTDTTTEWARIQDVTVTTTSLWSLMFAYGTLSVQAAGTTQNLTMTMVPEPEYWSGLIQSMADDATPTQV